jgi:murein L,D-transpeptidase YcbB/YkuD
LPLPTDVGGATGAWLRARLGLDPATVPTAEHVRRFQGRQALRVDGVIGAETLLALARVPAGPQVPE